MVSPALSGAIRYSWKGIGVSRAEYELSSAGLSVTLPGPQVGKSLHEVTIPLAALDGFYVKQPVRYRGGPRAAALNAGNKAMGLGGELLVAWRDGDRRRSKSLMMVDVADPEFQQLASALAAARPDADLRRLSEADARKRLGMWSNTAKALAFIAGVIVLLVLLAAYSQLTR
jgi:hypothetical protein